MYARWLDSRENKNKLGLKGVNAQISGTDMLLRTHDPLTWVQSCLSQGMLSGRLVYRERLHHVPMKPLS